ncbi:MAG: DUF2992 family protein [Oscillospiraceae bacterium]
MLIQQRWIFFNTEKKTEHKHISREKREAEKQYLFELKRQKRKEKHKGH